MEPEVRKAPIRFHEIDLLRFIAALSVVLFHYTYRGYAADNYSPLPFIEIGKFTRYGYLGVPLFFIISGYVILLSVQGKTLRQFLLSRVTRLYPAFWVAVTLTFLVKRIWSTAAMPVMLHAGWGQYVWSLTMFQEFLGVSSIDNVYSTLSVEIVFYFLISLLMGYRLIRHVDLFLISWLGLCLLPLLRIANLGTFFTTLFFPASAPYFAAGMLFFLMQQPKGRTNLRYALLLGFYLLALRSSAGEQVNWLRDHYHADFSRLVVAGAITSFFTLFLCITRQWLTLGRFAWLAGLGSLTYPLYLIHSDIGFIFFYRADGHFNKYLVLFGTISFMLTLAYLIHRLVEKPLSRPLGTFVNSWLQRLDAREE